MTADEWEPAPGEEQALHIVDAAEKVVASMPASLTPGPGVAIVTRLDGSHSTVVRHEASMWLTQQINPVLTAIHAGQVLPCAHPAPHGMSVPLWEPSRLLCPDCVLSFTTAGRWTAQLGVCHRCGEASPTVALNVMVSDALIVSTVVCDSCAERELI